MLLLDLSSCGPSGLLRVLYFFKLILDIVFIIIPIALIILLTIDFAKAVISGDEGAQKKTFRLAMKRILYAVIVFFVPTIVSIVNSVLGELGVEYSACYNDISIEAINQLEAEELAIEEAQESARLALLEEERKEQETISNINNSDNYISNGSGCDGLVYYDDGVFYKPSSSYSNGTKETKGSAPFGYNKYFYDMLNKMISDAKEEGYTIFGSNTEYGAWRPYKNQEYFWNCYQSKSCNSGNKAAFPGTSNHGWGIASDLTFYNEEARIWAHKNASKYELAFTVCDSFYDIDSYNFNDYSSRKKYFSDENCKEDWHIAPAAQIVDDSVVTRCS